MFLKQLFWSAVTQYFPRQVVDPILGFLHRIVGYGGNVLALRDEASHQRVLFLIGSTFTRRIRMGEIDTPLFERICKSTELITVVTGDALENLGEVIAILLAQNIQPSHYAGFCLAGNL